MSIKIKFSVDAERIDYFAHKLHQEDRDTIKDAKKNLKKVLAIWHKEEIYLKNFIKILFNRYKYSLATTVYVFPEYFRLGAVETNKKIILFGQPLRSKNFSSAVIIHELVHILLSRIGNMDNKMVNEIICFLVENQVYSDLDKKTLQDIWLTSELDKFHQAAFLVSLKYIKTFNILEGELSDFSQLLQKEISKKILKITPASGLLKNLPI